MQTMANHLIFMFYTMFFDKIIQFSASVVRKQTRMNKTACKWKHDMET